MRLLKFGTLTCALLAAAAAHATTYTASLLGSGIHQTGSGIDNVAWTGVLTVELDGVADGTYSGNTLESINLDTNWFDFGYVKGETQTQWEYAPFAYLPLGPEAGASVTITGGLLTSVNLTFDDYTAIYTLSGLTGAENSTCRTGNCHGTPDNIEVSGLLTSLPGVSAIPEPGNVALLLAGLGMVAVTRRSRANR